jgi:hypothetical protein
MGFGVCAAHYLVFNSYWIFVKLIDILSVYDQKWPTLLDSFCILLLWVLFSLNLYKLFVILCAIDVFVLQQSLASNFTFLPGSGVVRVCNCRYLEGRDKEDCGLKPVGK